MCRALTVNARWGAARRFIKMSSPNMNKLILVGSTLIYSSVVLFGADRTKLGLARRDSLSLICLVRSCAFASPSPPFSFLLFFLT